MTELIVTVVVASLLGSLHCVGMCGGFVAFYASDHGGPVSGRSQWAAHAAYNLGRLATYVTLGAVAGSIGAALNLAGEASGLAHLAAVVCGALIITWGALMLAQHAGARWARMPVPIWLNALFGRWLSAARGWPPFARAGVLGVSSALLPCGWLYGFAVSAAGTGSAASGATIMAAFWLGTVPALLGVGLGMRQMARALGPRLGLVMPTMLIVMGILTVAQRGGFSMGAPSAVAAAHACES